jgi:hypothetical protein
VISTGARNHGIHKAGTGVISTKHGMITARAGRLSTWTEEARGEIGKNPKGGSLSICMEGCC